MPDLQKRCKRCGELKPIDHFLQQRKVIGGDNLSLKNRRSYCRPCWNAATADYRRNQSDRKHQKFLKLLAEHGGLCTADIAEKMGISYRSARTVCGHMMRRGLLCRTPIVYHSSIYELSAKSRKAFHTVSRQTVILADMDAEQKRWFIQVQQQKEERQRRKSAAARV